MQFTAKAKAMLEEGIHIIDLSVGEPDFPTPQNIKDAALKAIEDNLTLYTLNTGMLELRKAIKNKLKKDNNLDYNISEIIVSNGAKQSIFNAILSITNNDDEIIIPSPYWASYPEMVKIAGGKPVVVKTNEDNGFKLTSIELKKAITNKTKALILCNPSNPTGTTYTKSELESLAEVIKKKSLFIIADEIYEKLVYDNFTFTSFASINKEIQEKTIVVNGVSKAYAMTGWRIGYAAGSEAIINEMNKIQSHSTSGASSISQCAAIEALTGNQDSVELMRSEFSKRRNYLYNELINIKDISCYKGNGAFYLFPCFSSYFNKTHNVSDVKNSFDLAIYLLHEAKVAVVPGGAFGADGYIRISFAASFDTIKEGIERIKDALYKLK